MGMGEGGEMKGTDGGSQWDVVMVGNSRDAKSPVFEGGRLPFLDPKSCLR